MAASADPRQLSPKFTWPLIIGFVVFAAAGALSLVTVEHFDWAGQWAGILHAFVTLIAMAVTAYYKMDPLRQNFAEQVRAQQAVQDAKLEQASAAEQAAVAAGPTQQDPEGKHRAQPVLYDPPSDLVG
ncbi:hypothetical protein [Arthrobacter burdickii]|uniref:Uncharacterized protein n=1 Tax=Arthrobacter burdickii TaxID=3035920 RepID=A0ABT8K3D3_9MICC|nr:hypothetical protein [Arthrobacter burdickii]MDN4611965.1 hypothetical protein [Arthrobacter burdickii]